MKRFKGERENEKGVLPWGVGERVPDRGEITKVLLGDTGASLGLLELLFEELEFVLFEELPVWLFEESETIFEELVGEARGERGDVDEAGVGSLGGADLLSLAGNNPINED